MDKMRKDGKAIGIPVYEEDESTREISKDSKTMASLLMREMR